MLGVDDKTVGVIRLELEGTAEIPQLEKTIGKDGKSRKKPRKHIPTAYIPEPEDEGEKRHRGGIETCARARFNLESPQSCCCASAQQVATALLPRARTFRTVAACHLPPRAV